MAKGKKYTDALKRFDREQLHAPHEAIDLVKSVAPGKFDESVELAVRPSSRRSFATVSPARRSRPRVRYSARLRLR